MIQPFLGLILLHLQTCPSFGVHYKLQSIESILEPITAPMKPEIQAHYIAERIQYFTSTKVHNSTVTAEAIRIFESKWLNMSTRMEIVPGKAVFSALNNWLQTTYRFSLTPASVVREFKKANIPQDLAKFLREVNQKFC